MILWRFVVVCVGGGLVVKFRCDGWCRGEGSHWILRRCRWSRALG